jgi:hypothetical protein
VQMQVAQLLLEPQQQQVRVQVHSIKHTLLTLPSLPICANPSPLKDGDYAAAACLAFFLVPPTHGHVDVYPAHIML